VLAARHGRRRRSGVGFRVGRRHGDRLLDHVPARLRRSGELDRALDLVRRRGAAAVVTGRWAAALRALVPGVAGTSGTPGGAVRRRERRRRDAAAAAAAVAGAGYASGASYRTLERVLGPGGEVLAAVVAVLVVLWVLRVRRRPSPAAPGGTQTGVLASVA
jgi:undecaprenyl-diphosphatase